MKILNQLLQFLKQAISAIFNFLHPEELSTVRFVA